MSQRERERREIPGLVVRVCESLSAESASAWRRAPGAAQLRVSVCWRAGRWFCVSCNSVGISLGAGLCGDLQLLRVTFPPTSFVD